MYIYTYNIYIYIYVLSVFKSHNFRVVHETYPISPMFFGSRILTLDSGHLAGEDA